MLWWLAALIATNAGVLVALMLLFREVRRTDAPRETPPDASRPRPRLEALLLAIPHPMLIVGRDGAICDEIATAAAVSGKSILDHLPDDAQAAMRQRLETAIDSGREQLLRFVTGDCWYVAQMRPLPAAVNRPGCALLLFSDVTDEKQAVQETQRLAARNEAILRSAMDGFFVVGEDYRFLEVNDAFCRMTGYSADELRQMTITQLEVSQQPRGLSNAHGRTGLHHVATAHRHKQGHVIQLESSVIVIRDEGRKVLVGFARDVTDRIRAEEALQAANERFASLVERMPLGYIVWTPDFRVQEWNPAAQVVFGFSAGETIGRPAGEVIVADEDAAVVQRFWERVLAGETSGHAVLPNIRKDRERVNCEWFYTVLRDAAGRVECVATMIRDVSERERLQAQLRQAQKLESLGILAGGVAHDFNNFLVGILCNASLALEKLGDKADAAHHVQKIINASRRASELTRQMLTYSGGARYDAQPMDLNHLVHELTDFIRAALPKNVSLTIDLADGLPSIEADSGQIQQVIMNLLINAAEAIGPNPGIVSITSSSCTLDARRIAAEHAGSSLAPGSYVCLKVADTGCGMAPETLARIFDPFFTTKFTGRGLGLATILGIVRGHRGAISVRSEPKRGTTFTVLFPVSTRPAAARSDAEAPVPLPPGATVLVIDDEEDIREVVQALLEAVGVRVLTAENGMRGLELFRQNMQAIDLVLLDMTMPGLSGEDVFREIVTLRHDARVILSSGYSEHEASTRFDAGRLAGFVQKPYTATALLEKLGAVLAGAG